MSRRVRHTTAVIPRDSIDQVLATSEYQAVKVPPKQVTVQLTPELLEFLDAEARELNVNLDMAASFVMARGIKMLKQVRQWREENKWLEAKSSDSYYENAGT